MTTFFSTRIETPYAPGIRESAIGLRALAGMDGFMKNDAPIIANKMFSIAPQFNEYPVATRLEAYKLIDFLMEKYRSTLIVLDGGFIKGLLGLAELEKDPRCLMLYFSM